MNQPPSRAQASPARRVEHVAGAVQQAAEEALRAAQGSPAKHGRLLGGARGGESAGELTSTRLVVGTSHAETISSRTARRSVRAGGVAGAMLFAHDAAAFS